MLHAIVYILMNIEFVSKSINPIKLQSAMNRNNHSNVNSAANQVTNNATSWIGHSTGDYNEIVGGQTFIVQKEGDLEMIEIFPNMVGAPGHLKMTVHQYNTTAPGWGPALAVADVTIENEAAGKWLPFYMPGIHLVKNAVYGFKVACTDALVGLGEGAGSFKQPLNNTGQEWKFINNNSNGDAYSYLNLTFNVQLKN